MKIFLYSVCDAKLVFISHSTVYSIHVSVNPVISQTQHTTILFLFTAKSLPFCIFLHLILTSKNDLFPDGFHKYLGIGTLGDKANRSSLRCLGMSGCIVGWCVRYVRRQSILSNVMNDFTYFLLQ